MQAHLRKAGSRLRPTRHDALPPSTPVPMRSCALTSTALSGLGSEPFLQTHAHSKPLAFDLNSSSSTVADAGLRHQLGSFQRRGGHEFLQVHVQGERCPLPGTRKQCQLLQPREVFLLRSMSLWPPFLLTVLLRCFLISMGLVPLPLSCSEWVTWQPHRASTTALMSSC